MPWPNISPHLYPSLLLRSPPCFPAVFGSTSIPATTSLTRLCIGLFTALDSLNWWEFSCSRCWFNVLLSLRDSSSYFLPIPISARWRICQEVLSTRCQREELAWVLDRGNSSVLQGLCSGDQRWWPDHCWQHVFLFVSTFNDAAKGARPGRSNCSSGHRHRWADPDHHQVLHHIRERKIQTKSDKDRHRIHTTIRVTCRESQSVLNSHNSFPSFKPFKFFSFQDWVCCLHCSHHRAQAEYCDRWESHFSISSGQNMNQALDEI